MAQLQAGTTYSAEDNTVTVANLNSHVSAAILLDDAVSAQTALGAAPASDDVVLISDTDAATLKSATTTELLGTELAAWVGKGASGGTAALQIDGVDKLSVDSSGDTTVAGTTTMTGAATASSTLGVTGVTTLSDHLNLLTNKEVRLQDAADNEYVGIKAPITVSDSYTMTMPAAVGASGTVLKTTDAAGTLEWGAEASGKVLQVIFAQVTAATFNTTSTTMTDITGLTASITPASTSNRILVQCMISVGGSATNFPAFGLKRDTTQIGSSTSGTSNRRNSICGSHSGAGSGDSLDNVLVQYLDDPSTTSEVDYIATVSCRSGDTFNLNKPNTDADAQYTVHGISTITLTEIAG